MPPTLRKQAQQPLTRLDIIAGVYESLIESARRNRRFSDIILDTRVLGASIDSLTGRWRVTVAMPVSNLEVATIIERAIKMVVHDASTVFN